MLRRNPAAESFLGLLEPLRHSLYGYARRAAWRGDQAADMVQEAVLAAWREFHRFEPGTNFHAWIFKIMVNTVFNFNKRVARERAFTQASEELPAEALLDRETAWSSILEEPDRLMSMLDERVVHALDALSSDERQCLLLRLLEGFTYKEIASMLGIPLGTAMSHVHRARMALRERLAGLALELGIVREART